MFMLDRYVFSFKCVSAQNYILFNIYHLQDKNFIVYYAYIIRYMCVNYICFNVLLENILMFVFSSTFFYIKMCSL